MRNHFFIGLFLVIVGVVLIVVGLMEQGLAAMASKEPEEIALKDLIARGPDGNPNILLKDYELGENFIYKTKNSRWQDAWVPAIPHAGPARVGGGKPAVIQALIFTTNARDEATLYQLCGQPKLRALVTNRITSLGTEEKRLLEQSYPGTDFGRCLIIQEGREPAGPMKVLLMVGGGSLLGLGGLGLCGLGIRKWKRERAARYSADIEPETGKSGRADLGGEEEPEPPRRTPR